MEITIDEWIVHHINNPDKCQEAFVFLKKVFDKCDKIVALRGGGVMSKIWSMSETSHRWEQKRRKVAKYFFRTFLQNSDKFIILERKDLSKLPEDLRKQTPEDDLYLVETAMSTKDKLILTTDRRLKERLSGWEDLDIQLVDEFLQRYDC